MKYSKEHVWLLEDGETATIGITDFAQSELGEIIYVELPQPGKKFDQDEVFGSVEAIKTVSDLFMPVSGEIIAINPLLKDQPTLVNNEPFANGWMIKIKITKTIELQKLITVEEYAKLTGTNHE